MKTDTPGLVATQILLGAGIVAVAGRGGRRLIRPLACD